MHMRPFGSALLALVVVGAAWRHAADPPTVASSGGGVSQAPQWAAHLPLALRAYAGPWPTSVAVTPAAATATATSTPTPEATASGSPTPTPTKSTAAGVPDCAGTTGDRGGLRFSLDGGATLAPNAARLDRVAYTWDLDIDPRDPDLILELHQGTLFRSDDAGCTLRTLATLERQWDNLVRAPSDPDLLVATSVFFGEIGVSRNAGSDWSLQSVPDDVVHFAIDPLDPEHWVFAGRNGLYERLGAQARWTGVPAPLPDGVSITAAAHAPTAFRTWLVGDAVRGVFRTDDMQTWTEANAGMDGEIGAPPERVQAIVPVWLAFAPGDSSVAYASVNRVARDASQRGIWRTATSGASWAARVIDGDQVGDRAVQLTGGTRIFVSPHDPDHVLFPFGINTNGYGTDLFRSRDGLRTLAVSHFDDFYEVMTVAFGPAGTDVLFVGASSDIPGH